MSVGAIPLSSPRWRGAGSSTCTWDDDGTRPDYNAVRALSMGPPTERYIARFKYNCTSRYLWTALVSHDE